MDFVKYLITWAGYSVLAYGAATVRGCNIKWSDIAIPGRWAKSNGCSPDTGSTTTTSTTTASASAPASVNTTTVRSGTAPASGPNQVSKSNQILRGASNLGLH